MDFTVFVKPRGQGRPRAAIVNGKVIMYKTKEDKEYEYIIMREYLAQENKEYFPEGIPLRLIVQSFTSPAKSIKGKAREKLLSSKFYLQKSDADNQLKSVADALNGVAYKDDSQIAIMKIGKFWCDDPNMQRLEIRLEEIKE